MKPLRSGWNLTPTSIAAGSAFEALTGVALLGQIVHGQVTGPIVGVAVGVAVGGAGVAVGGGAPWTSAEKVPLPLSVALAAPAQSLTVVPLPSLKRQFPTMP